MECKNEKYKKNSLSSILFYIDIKCRILVVKIKINLCSLFLIFFLE